MPITKRLLPSVALAAMLSLAACKDSTSPAAFDSASLDTQLQALSSTVDGNAAFQSLLALSGYFPTLGAPPVFTATLPAVAGSATVSPLARSAAVAHLLPRANDMAALFPANVLGKTIVWNPDSGHYVVDQLVTGAPATGVRIRLYSVDQFSGGPVLPLQILGYVDLTDQSTASADILGVTLKLGATTVADYAITRVKNTNSASLTIVGYITAGDGSGRTDFNHSLAVTGATLTWNSNLHNTTTAVLLQIQGDTLGNGSELLRLTHNGNALEFNGTATTGGDFGGQLNYNGSLIATVSVVNGQPTFTGANGHNLSVSDQNHLTAIMAGMELVVLETFTGLLAPFLVIATMALPI